MQTPKIHQALSEDVLARYLRAPVAIEGDLRAPVWICGIEFGGDAEAMSDECLLSELAGFDRRGGLPDTWNEKCDQFRADLRRWPFHRWVAKLMVGLRHAQEAGQGVPSGSDCFAGWQAYRDEKLYRSGGDVLHMNLYPFSSRAVIDEGWSRIYAADPLLADKGAYYARCHGERFALLKACRERFRPPVIVATGIDSSETFARAFGFAGEPVRHELLGTRRVERRTQGGSSLFCVPFFGSRYGINSNALMVALVRLVAAHADLGRVRGEMPAAWPGAGAAAAGQAGAT